MKSIGKIIDLIFAVVKYFIAMLFGWLVILVFLQVFNRFLLNSALAWSEETANYTMMWIALLGASMLIGCQQRNSKDGDDCYFCYFTGDISLLVDLWMCCISANCEGHALPGNTATHGNCGFGFFDFWHFDANWVV